MDKIKWTPYLTTRGEVRGISDENFSLRFTIANLARAKAIGDDSLVP